MEEEETPYPPWLKAQFFSICEIHESCKENERNHHCLDCTTYALCPCCLIHHENYRVTQIRRSFYHEVIKVEDIQKYLDVSDIQPYTMNKAPIVFLNKRPQKEPKKGYKYACDICQRGIAHHSKFCLLGCKNWLDAVEEDGYCQKVPHLGSSFTLRGIEDGIPELRFNTSINYHTNELHGDIEVDESSKETKVARLDSLKEQATEPFHSLVSGITETMNSPSPPTLPIYNHFNSRKKRVSLAELA